jgi:hypothetical protein
MNRKEVLILLLAFFLLSRISYSQEKAKDFPVLRGPYLGQAPPGTTPEIFAPGIVSTPEHEYGISFSRDGREIYLKRMVNGQGKNLVFCYENGQWQEPKEVRFHEEGRYGELHLTPDGKYLLSNQINPGAAGNPESTIVRFVRENGIWTNPVTVGPGMRATSTEKGDIYVTVVLDYKVSLGAIGRYRFCNGNYEKVEMLKGEINLDKINSSHPFIAPDESYLIFGSKRGDDASGSLYVAFKGKDGDWSRPLSLSKRLDPNKNTNHWIAAVSPDGKYLFYNAGSDIYWVSARIIEDLRREAP